MIKTITIVAVTILVVPMLIFGFRHVLWWMFGIDKIIELLEKIKDEA